MKLWLQHGKINSLEGNESANSVLLIPIQKLTVAHIDFIKNGNIGLKPNVLEISDVHIVLPQNNKFDINNLKINITTYDPQQSSCYGEVRKILGISYSEKASNTSDYEIFANNPPVSDEEALARKQATLECLYNSLNDLSGLESIKIDGDLYELTPRDLDILNNFENNPLTELSSKKIREFINKINDLFNKKNSLFSIGSNIDYFSKTLLEYFLELFPKSRANYYEEQNTIVEINGKKLSIKPPLPAKNSNIGLRYTRKSEHIAIKAIKLARMLNIFAHHVDSFMQSPNIQGDSVRYGNLEKLRDSLYDAKRLLIEKTIDYAKYSNIDVLQNFDIDKLARVIMVIVPRLGVIQLHCINITNELSKKIKDLPQVSTLIPEKFQIMHNPLILNGGVNEAFLLELKSLSHSERVEFFMKLPDETFFKICIRMGWPLPKSDKEDYLRNYLTSNLTDFFVDEAIKENEDRYDN